MTSCERLFVYGTLRSQGSNHDLMSGAVLLGPWRTIAAFRMEDLGAYPGVFRQGKTAISGEVYGIDRRLLRRLDQLEDYPRTYTRERIGTGYGVAWIYLYRKRHVYPHMVVRSGDWIEHAQRKRSTS